MIAMGWSRFLTGDTRVVGGDGFLRLLLFCFCLIEVILPLHVQFCSPHQVDLIKPIADFFYSIRQFLITYLDIKLPCLKNRLTTGSGIVHWGSLFATVPILALASLDEHRLT